ncbi:MAG: hypothetical protein RQ866_07920 [Bacteroidales bacterium]|nr:hypothetical protein [Bacteroidales bacterium]
MHTTEILWLLSWPVFIYISYKLSVYAIKRYESKNEATHHEEAN